MAETKVKTVETKETPRKKRVPFGTKQSKLEVSQAPDGFRLAWINDEDYRLQQAQDGGYTFVAPSEVGRPSRDGEDKIQEHVGMKKDGSPLFAYLMKIPLEWYLEDKAVNTKLLDDIDSSIKGGTINQQAGSGRYVPEAGISYDAK